MKWMDIACIVFVCTTMSHLGLISAIEEFIKKKIPILNCPKCSTWWVTMAYGIGKTWFSFDVLIPLLAISFLASYAAIWLELFEGFIDTIYTRIYETIFTDTNDNAPASDTANGDTASTLP